MGPTVSEIKNILINNELSMLCINDFKLIMIRKMYAVPNKNINEHVSKILKRGDGFILFEASDHRI